MATRPGVETPQLRHRRVAAIRCLTGSLLVGASIAASQPVFAQEWDIEPVIELIATYSDNLYLAQEGAETGSGVLQIIPGISIVKNQGRFTTRTDYRAQGLVFSESSDLNTVYHELNATATMDLVPERLFVDLDAAADQIVVDPSESIPLSNVAATSNLGDVYSANINPYLIQRLGGADAYLRVDYLLGMAQYEDFGLETFSRVDDFTQQMVGFYLGSDEQDDGLEWSINYNHRDVDYDTVQDFAFERVQAALGIPLTAGFRLIAMGGAESDLLVSRDEGGLDSDFWEVGFRINSGPRRSFEFRTGERFFGTSYFGNLAIEGRRLSATIGYTENPTTSALNEFGSLTSPFAVSDGGAGTDDPPPTDDIEIGPLLSEVYVSKILRARLDYSARRSTLYLSYFDEDRDILDEPVSLEGSEDGQSSITAGIIYELGPRTDLEMSVARMNYSYADTTTEAETDQVVVGILRQLGRGLDMRIAYRYAKQETDSVSQFNNYTENAIDLGFIKRF